MWRVSTDEAAAEEMSVRDGRRQSGVGRTVRGDASSEREKLEIGLLSESAAPAMGGNGLVADPRECSVLRGERRTGWPGLFGLWLVDARERSAVRSVSSSALISSESSP